MRIPTGLFGAKGHADRPSTKAMAKEGDWESLSVSAMHKLWCRASECNAALRSAHYAHQQAGRAHRRKEATCMNVP